VSHKVNSREIKTAEVVVFDRVRSILWIRKSMRADVTSPCRYLTEATELQKITTRYQLMKTEDEGESRTAEKP
jgi:hypothetical protein